MSGLIDVHHHFIPASYKKALIESGITHSAGRSIADWTPEMSLRLMDSLDIELAYGSISEPALYPLVSQNPEKATIFCRQINEDLAEMKARYTGRFGVFALLPMPEVQKSVEELCYALDELKLDGIGLLSNYRSEFLGNTAFDQILKALDERSAVVYVHPSVPITSFVRPQFIQTDFIEEFCFNTTRAATNLIMSGAMERFPHIRFIFSHMGGTLPYLRWRLTGTIPFVKHFTSDPELRKGYDFIKQPIDAYLKRMWFDTALATDRYVYDIVQDMAPNHIVFGTDAFYATEEIDKLMIKQLRDMTSVEEFKRISRTNALNLFAKQ